MISLIRKLVCLNQKQTIKYEYTISEEHKKIKEYFTSTNTTDKDKLLQMYEEFIVKSYSDMLQIFEENRIVIEDFFKKLKKEKPPRIIIKIIHDKERVLNFYKSTGNSNFQSSLIKENTGFSKILYENKLFFLENNIPNAFKKGEYINPRLDTNKRKLFKEGKITWKECWKDYGSTPFEFYSSTLILPMSIRSEISDFDSENFYKHFFDNVEQHSDSRTIWGFLCFDSEETDYFISTNNELIDLGYIIADILSLYLMYFYNHVTGSNTIKNIEKFLFDNTDG